MRRKIWSRDMTSDYWENEAPDSEILEYAEDYYNCGCGEEDFVEHDKDGNVVSCDYDGLRNWLCERSYDSWADEDYEDFSYNLIPGVVKQINHDFLLIDGEQIEADWSGNARDENDAWVRAIWDRLRDYYDNAEIYVNDYEEIEDWYTLPKEDSKLYNLARHLKSVRDAVETELRNRFETDVDSFDYIGNGRDLWMEVFWELLNDENIAWTSDIEKYLVPIRNPYMIE